MHYLSRALLLGALVSAVAGCTPSEDSSVQLPCPSRTLVNVVEPDPHARLAGIGAYRYVAPLDARALKVDLFESPETGDAFGTLHVEQVFGDGALANGTMRVQLGETTLTTRGDTAANGLSRVLMRVTRGADTMRIEADLRHQPCFDTDGPQCAGALDVDAPHVLLPTCGLDFDTHVRSRTAPVVVGLRYLVEAAHTEGKGDGLRRTADRMDVVVRVLEDGQPRPAADVQAAIDRVGGPLARLLAHDEVRTLSAAYFDATWRRTLAHHAATCLASEHLPAEAVRTPATQQSALCDGDNTARDSSAWGGGRSTGSSAGRSWGDPHLRTFDGLAYDFQAEGDFVLAASTGDDVDDLVVQARFQPLNASEAICRNVSFTTGLAVQTGGHVFAVQDGQVLLDGAAVTQAALDALSAPGLTVDAIPGAFALELADGTRITADGRTRLDVSIAPGPARAGSFVGLLGNADGRPANDLRAGERVLTAPVGFDTKYGVFRDTWRVRAEDALFTYPAGTGPDDVFNPASPDGPVRLDMLSASERHDAQRACGLAGVVDGADMLDCIVDAICAPSAARKPPAATAPATAHDREDVLLTGALALDVRDAAFDPGKPHPSATPQGETCTPRVPFVGQVFDEGETVLSAPLALDITAPGQTTPSMEALPAGTRVRTWLLHVPPHAAGEDPRPVVGTLTFAAPPHGLITRDAGIADARFVPPAQTVADAPGRGFTLDATTNEDALSWRDRTLSIALYTRDTAESVRIVEVLP